MVQVRRTTGMRWDTRKRCIGCGSCWRVWCFFFTDTATTEIYTLSLHDALPIWLPSRVLRDQAPGHARSVGCRRQQDRKSTRLNSSHVEISYAVFCLKKKKKKKVAIATHRRDNRSRTTSVRHPSANPFGLHWHHD